jgi:hypothetical protein
VQVRILSIIQHVPLAQWAARFPDTKEVTGSNPVWNTDGKEEEESSLLSKREPPTGEVPGRLLENELVRYQTRLLSVVVVKAA